MCLPGAWVVVLVTGSPVLTEGCAVGTPVYGNGGVNIGVDTEKQTHNYSTWFQIPKHN